MKSRKRISSNANAQFKHLKKLRDSARERRQCGQTLLDGVHLLNSLAQHGLSPNELFISQSSDATNAEIRACLAQFPNVTVTEMDANLFNQLSPVDTPTGILALYEIQPVTLRSGDLSVMLERIQDPGNLGAILRTAAAAGAQTIYLSPGCADAWSPKVLRAGMGAHFVIDIFEDADLATVTNDYPTVIATSLNATTSLYESDLTGKLALLFGNEGEGLSPQLLTIATHQVKIPMPGNMESLNVAAASAVCLFECVRQRTTR